MYQRYKDGSITDSDINTLSKLGILDKKTSEEGGTQSNQDKWDKDNNFTTDFRNQFKISYGPKGELLTEGFGLEGYGKD